MDKKRQRNLYETIRFIVAILLVSFGMAVAAKFLNPATDCLQEFWCEPGATWWMFGLSQGLFIAIQILLGLFAVYGALVLLFRKTHLFLAGMVSGFLILLTVINLFINEPSQFQEPFVIPVSVLNIAVAIYFAKKMIQASQVDWKNKSAKSSLYQMISYRYYFKKKTPWSAVLWLVGLFVMFSANVITLAQDVNDWSPVLWFAGFIAILFSPLVYLGLRKDNAFLAITENGEVEARLASGSFKTFKFPLKEVSELRFHWYIFMPDEMKKNDSARSIKQEVPGLLKSELSNVKNFDSALKPKQRKLETNAGTKLLSWPNKIELLDCSGKRLMLATVNHEDKEEMLFYKSFKDAKITHELEHLGWNIHSTLDHF